MAQKMSRGQVQDLLTKFAVENPKYRAALLSDPRGVIEKQLNVKLGDTQIKAVADSASVAYVVVPHVPAEGELSDADLEKVAGGKQDITADCTVIGLAAAGNTVTQINM